MSNVISVEFGANRAVHKGLVPSVLSQFAKERCPESSIYWMKENGELLNILKSVSCHLGPHDLSVYDGFYQTLEERLSFFPQYYRFLLSIAQDLEALGMHGAKSYSMAKWIKSKGLAEAELSDLQRCEVHRLMSRAGIRPSADIPAVWSRLNRFINHKETFAVPNRKAAYELTHIVFYFSNYGRQDPKLDAEALVSLEYAGILAFLDMNVDLLAEVCIAMRFAGMPVNEVWENWIEGELSEYVFSETHEGLRADDYHSYFICNWLRALRGGDVFSNHPLFSKRLRYERPIPSQFPLRLISQVILSMNETRRPDWHNMRTFVTEKMSEDTSDFLQTVENSSGRFAEFFSTFSRSDMVVING
ncbi:MAG: DUF6902 family protein [Paracoccaceae bacterium]